jgi:hypothetical protein
LADNEGSFRYRQDVLDALWQHGVQPTARSRPEMVHEFVSDLYRYELRCLRDRLLRKDFPKKEYADRVIALRRRYRLISMRPSEWLG